MSIKEKFDLIWYGGRITKKRDEKEKKKTEKVKSSGKLEKKTRVWREGRTKAKKGKQYEWRLWDVP